MRMAGLRHAFARRGGTREDIPLDQRYLLEVVGENTRGKQAGDAAADNHGMVKGAARHGVAPPLCKLLRPIFPRSAGHLPVTEGRLALTTTSEQRREAHCRPAGAPSPICIRQTAPVSPIK